MRQNNELIGRREFFGSLLKDMKYLAGTALSVVTPKKNLIRPPGALEEIAFSATCQRCGKCKVACLENAIRIAGPDQGTALGTPYLVPDEQPCTFCLKCIEACPNGALEIQRNTRDYAIGIATIDTNRCLAYNDQICGSCLNTCPVANRAIQLKDFRFPVIDPEKCNGCGQCARFCVAEHTAIEVTVRK